MNRFKILMLVLSLAPQTQAKLVVHEWGTFTSLVGSDGKAQNGMFYEDEVLPDFVHNFGDQIAPKSLQLIATEIIPPVESCPGRGKIQCEFLLNQVITQKMETPVVYFYSDIEQKVKFDVQFPKGIISQSYPAPLVSLPEAVPGVELINGFAGYEVNILKNSNLTPPFVEDDNIYSHARHVASDLVQFGDEVEKFIFYRGLGEFKTELETTSQSGRLRLKNAGLETIPQAFVIYTDGASKGSLISVGSIRPGKTVSLSANTTRRLQSTPQPQNVFMEKARAELLRGLIGAGLFQDEALAMVNTWEHGYFKTPGLRVLYILSRSEVEAILPARVTPQPEELGRVFVGRIEILLDTQEQKVLEAILSQGQEFDVTSLGRMAHPILLRVREVAQEKGILNPGLDATFTQFLKQLK